MAEADVTYVNGIAAEQTTEGETPAEGSDHGDERAAAIAAVKEALEAEGKQAAKEAKAHREKDPLIPRDRDESGKFAPSPEALADQERAAAVKKLEKTPGTPVEKPAAPEEDEDATALKKALNARKEAAKAKAEAGALLERERNEARRIYQEVQREKAALAQERAKYERYRKDPLSFVNESGRSPEDLILEIATAGTPEAKARAERAAERAELDEIKAWRKAQEDGFKAHQAAQEKAQKAQFRRDVEQRMLQTATAKAQTGEEKYPHLATYYADDHHSLFAQADTVADQYREATGEEATFDELCEYLEMRAAKWYKQMNSKRSAQVAAPVGQGTPTQGVTTGRSSVSGRGLSPAMSAERRSLGTIADLDGDERREAALIAVRAALHASGER